MTNPIEQETASAILKQQLADWGLSTLYGDVDKLIKDGLGNDQITLALQQTPAYKQRFIANEARVKNGLAALSPAQYIATENAYRQAMQSYGLPQGFWDQQSDFQKLLENDVSPQEVSQRAQDAQQIWLSSDPGLRRVWQDFYGLTDGAAIAQILDPGTAEPVIKRMVTATQLGSLAEQNGLTADRGRLEQYADQGVTAGQAQQGFAEIGQTLGTLQGIAQRNGTSFSQAEAEGARITGLASAVRKQTDLAHSEQALFDARAAVDAKSLSKPTLGSY